MHIEESLLYANQARIEKIGQCEQQTTMLLHFYQTANVIFDIPKCIVNQKIVTNQKKNVTNQMSLERELIKRNRIATEPLKYLVGQGDTWC